MAYREWTKTLKLTVCDDADNKYEVDVEVEVYWESDYGADADGNRGVEMTSIADFDIKDVRDEHGISRLELTDTLYNKIFDAMNEADLSKEE